MIKEKRIEINIQKLSKPGYFCYFVGPYEIVKGQTIYVGEGCNLICKVDGEYFDLIKEEREYSISSEYAGQKLELYVVDTKENNCNFGITADDEEGLTGYSGSFKFKVKNPRLFSKNFNYNTSGVDEYGIKVMTFTLKVNQRLNDANRRNISREEEKTLFKGVINEVLDEYYLEMQGEVLINSRRKPKVNGGDDDDFFRKFF